MGEGKREAQALQGKRLSIPAPRDVKEFLILHSVSAGRIHPGITNPVLMPFARAGRADSIRVEQVRRPDCDLHAAMRNCGAERRCARLELQGFTGSKHYSSKTG